jgi:hypothetical protein
MAKKTYIDKKGYKRDKKTGKAEHRTNAERKVGGKIYPGRVVHHKDGNKLNNDPSNLQVMSRSDHGKLHASQRQESQGSQKSGCLLGGILSILRWL